MTRAGKQSNDVVRQAFHDAWLRLLNEERVVARNVAHLPQVLLHGILEATEAGERQREKLVQSGLQCVADYEEDRLRLAGGFEMDRSEEFRH